MRDNYVEGCVACSKGSSKPGGIAGLHRQEVPLVNDITLALLQLCTQTSQLALVFAQQRSLICVLIHVCQIADAFSSVGELERTQRFCRLASTNGGH